MGINGTVMAEGLRLFFRRRLTKTHHRFSGEPRDIIKSIVNKNWNGKYFQASHGNFTSFYMRDFGMSTESLLFMGYRKQVHKTLEYILDIFYKNNKITTTITPDGKPIDMFAYGCDTVPYLIRSIRISNAFYLARKYSEFLNEKVQEYYDTVFDREKEIVYENKNFSSMKDNHKRNSSMYANCCAAMLSQEVDNLKANSVVIRNPFRKWNAKKTLKDRFWVGTHFLDDISAHHHISADANIIPYYFGIFNDKSMLDSSINTIVAHKLDMPIPAKYTAKPIKEKENSLLSFFAGNYQGNTCWTNLGVLLMWICTNNHKILLRKYIDIYLEFIEEEKNFLEIFNPDGTKYKTFFYMYDEGMLWSSIFYQVLEEYYQPLKHYKIR